MQRAYLKSWTDCRYKTELHRGHRIARGQHWTREIWTTTHWRRDWRREKYDGAIHSAGACDRLGCQKRRNRSGGRAVSGEHGTTNMRDTVGLATTCRVRSRKLRACSEKASGHHTLSGLLLNHRHQHTTTLPYLRPPRRTHGHNPAHKDRLYQPVHRKNKYTDPPARPRSHHLCLQNHPLLHNRVHTTAPSHRPYLASTPPALPAHHQSPANTPTNDLPHPQMSSTTLHSNPRPFSKTATRCAPSSYPHNSAPSSSAAQATTHASISRRAACYAAF
jgi:hypothetical protein